MEEINPIAQFKTALEKEGGLDSTEWALIESISESRHLPAKAFFLKEGEYSTSFAFVVQGILRHFLVDSDGREHSIDFCAEGEFTGLTEAFVDNTIRSPLYIQALEECSLIVCEIAQVKAILDRAPGISSIMNRVLLGYLCVKNSRERHLMSLNPDEAYTKFLNEYPRIAQRIPGYLIASYLGMSPETLSRVRARRGS